MKTKIQALFLVLVLMLTMPTGAIAAGGKNAAALSVETAFIDGQLAVTVSITKGTGVTNGRVAVTYNPQLVTLTGNKVTEGLGASSVNAETVGTVSLAWVGSDFVEAETQLLHLTFRYTGTQDATFTAKALELYAGEETLEAKDASATAVYNPFQDIEKHWAKEEILKAHHAGLFVGMDKTHFGPEHSMERAMFVTILYRMAGSPAVENLETGFKDVNTKRYYASAIAWAVNQGIVKGVGAGRFAPHKDINRQEIATMLYRYAEKTGRDVSVQGDLSAFRDIANVADWAEEAMTWAVAEEILIGFPGGYLMPWSNATRAQAAVIICRYADL